MTSESLLPHLDQLPDPGTKAYSSLIQKRRGATREFVLYGDVIDVREASFYRTEAYRLRLDHLADVPTLVHTSSPRLHGAALLAALAALQGLTFRLTFGIPASGWIYLALVLLGAFAAAYHLSRRTELLYRGADRDLVFWDEAAHREDLELFLEELARRREALFAEALHQTLESRGRRDGPPPSGPGTDAGDPPDRTPVDDLERLSWLFEQGFLTDDEFGTLKAQVVGTAALGSGLDEAEPVN